MLLTPTLTDHNRAVHLRTLGGLELVGTSFTRPKPLLLLAYLALEGPQERRHLAELFWPEAADHMKSLTVALTQLRQGAPGAIQADNQRCWVLLRTDAQDFLTRLDQGDLEAALTSYPTPFLRGFHLPELGVELEEWTLKTREYLAGRARQAMLNLAEQEASRGEFANAARRAEAAYTLSGAAEPETEELVRIYPLLLAGDNPLAVEVRKELQSLGHEVELLDSPNVARGRLSRATKRQTPLPTRNTPFMGRKHDQQQLKLWLQEQRLISIVGPAGVGKTRLALQLAQEMQSAQTFAAGVHFVDLEPLENPEHLLAHIAHTLQLEVGANQDPVLALAEAAAKEAALWVLDNFEHLIEAAPSLSQLLRACPHLHLLVTSRERLGLEEEQVFSLTSLRYPNEAVLLEEAERFYSVQLLIDRARRARADFTLRQEDLGAVVQICRVVDGLPLGLELAAAWVRVMSLEEIAHELNHSLDLLSSTARNIPERHKSIRTAFEYSWKLLPPKEQDVLRKLSVFRGGFRREAASEVAGATIPILASLVDKSFLRLDQDGRYHRHPLVYALTKEKLAQAPGLQQASQQQAQYFVQMLESIKPDLSGPKHGHALKRVAEELENIRLAWQWMVQSERWDWLEAALGVVCVFFDHRNRHHEGLEMLQWALQALEHSPQKALRGRILADSAWSLHRIGDHLQATARAKEALALLPPESGSALSSLNVVASIAWKRGDYLEARSYWFEALQKCEAQGHTRGIGRFLGNLAIAEMALGNTGSARAQLKRSLDIAHSISDHLTVPQNYNRLGDLEFEQLNFEEAQKLWQRGLEYAQQQGIENAIPILLHNLGRLAAQNGEMDHAQALLQQSLEGSRKARDLYLQSLTLKHLGEHAAQEDPTSAEAFLAQALKVAHAAQAMPVFLASALVLAKLGLGQHNLKAAIPLLHLVADHPATEAKDRDLARQILQEVGSGESAQVSMEEVLKLLAIANY